MRVAVLVLALCLTAIVGLQSCTLMVGGGIVNDQPLSEGGSMGIIVALLFVVGGAFSMGLPRVSQIVFAVAGILGFIAGSQGKYDDMFIWASVALILSVMSHFGARELRKKKTISQT